MTALRFRRLAGRTTIYLILTVAAVLTLLPLGYAFFASFKPLDEILNGGARLLPEQWTLDNYRTVWARGGFARYFLNSVVIAAGVVILDLLISSFVGYLLARRLIRFHKLLLGVMSAVLFIGVGTATLYPRFVIAQALGIDNLVGIILVEVSTVGVVHMFLIKAFVESLPVEVEEAARIDGNGLFGVYGRVALPLMRPILTTTVILAFQAAWSNFQIPYVFTLAEPDLRTLVVGVYALRTSGEGTEAYDLMLTGAMIIIIPVVVLFILLQKHFVRGMTEGGVK